MAARQVDFEMHAGDYKILEFTIVDAADVAVPLGGITEARWWVAKSVTATTYLIQKSIGSGITVYEPANGKLQVVLSSADTELLGGKVLYHELEIKDAGGNPQTVLYGTMTLTRRLVTNPIP